VPEVRELDSFRSHSFKWREDVTRTTVLGVFRGRVTTEENLQAAVSLNSRLESGVAGDAEDLE